MVLLVYVWCCDDLIDMSYAVPLDHVLLPHPHPHPTPLRWSSAHILCTQPLTRIRHCISLPHHTHTETEGSTWYAVCCVLCVVCVCVCMPMFMHIGAMDRCLCVGYVARMCAWCGCVCAWSVGVGVFCVWCAVSQRMHRTSKHSSLLMSTWTLLNDVVTTGIVA